MSSIDQQIKTSFEDLGLTPEEISEQTGYDLLAIKTILLNISGAYRKACKKDVALGLNKVETEEMKTIMLNIARYEEDDQTLKFKAAQFLYNEGRGRNEVKPITTTTINFNNVIAFNEQMKKALAARERTLKQIDVTSTVVEQEKVA